MPPILVWIHAIQTNRRCFGGYDLPINIRYLQFVDLQFVDSNFEKGILFSVFLLLEFVE